MKLRRHALRRHPVGVLAAVLAAVLVAKTASAPRVTAVPSFLAVMAATFWVARHARPKAAALGLGVAVIAVGIAQSLAPPSRYPHAAAIPFFEIVLVIAPAVAGGTVRARAQLTERLRLAASRVRAARDSQISAVLIAERRRIASELDRVMLDGLDGMRRHAAAADREEVADLERIARGALAEMRGLLVRFRGGDVSVQARDPYESQDVGPSLPELRARVTAALAAEAARRPAGARSAAMASGAAVPFPALPGAARWALPSQRSGDVVLTVLALTLAAELAATRAWQFDAILGIAIMGPVAVLRRCPLPAATVSLLATIGYSMVARPADPLAGVPPVGAFVLVPLVVSAISTLTRSVTLLAACLTTGVLAIAADPVARVSVVSVAPVAAITLASWAVGRAMHDGGRMLSALAQATAQAQDEEAADTRQAVADDRLRIARELHDAVGHALTAVLMQATAARKVWDADAALAAWHVAALRETTTEAVAELHALVVSVATGPDGAPAGGAGLRALAERASDRGLPVRFCAAGTEGPLPPVAGQAAYRILQEAITNAARHAPGTWVDITVRYDADALRLEISNEPPAAKAVTSSGMGHGLRGMRERAQACGGTVEAGPRPDGGFTVRAWLPHQAAAQECVRRAAW